MDEYYSLRALQNEYYSARDSVDVFTGSTLQIGKTLAGLYK